LNEQDVNRFQLAKAINEAEGLLASKEAELTALNEETRVLEESDPAMEHERELVGTA
jgi:kinetochore protein Spc24